MLRMVARLAPRARMVAISRLRSSVALYIETNRYNSTTMTIGVGAAPNQSRQINHLLTGRSFGEGQVGDAETGRDVDRLRDPITPNESQKPLSRLATRNTARVDWSAHERV